jgi:hypothetical protein
MEKMQLFIALLITAAIVFGMIDAIIEGISERISQKFRKMLGMGVVCAVGLTGGITVSTLVINKLVENYNNAEVVVVNEIKDCVSDATTSTPIESVFTQLVSANDQDNNGISISTTFMGPYNELKHYMKSWRTYQAFTAWMKREVPYGNIVREIMKGPSDEGFEDTG